MSSENVVEAPETVIGQMTFEAWFQQTDSLPERSVSKVVELAQDGATIPFIARYRKEATGNLDEVAIESILDQHEKWRHLKKRQGNILKEIESQEKLTPELKALIESTYNIDDLEDIYLPYKKKKATKAQKAKVLGLEPLANKIWESGQLEATDEIADLEVEAQPYVKEDLPVDQVLSGAQDIIVERMVENKVLRSHLRQSVGETGHVYAIKGKKAKEHSKFENYFDFKQPIKTLLEGNTSHRYLAIRRGREEKELEVYFQGDFEELSKAEFTKFACPKGTDCKAYKFLSEAATRAYISYVFPSIETELNRDLKESADLAAIDVFSRNVRRLLLAAPFGPKPVLGVDPGIRTGCKVAVIGRAGEHQGNFVIFPEKKEEIDQIQTVVSEVVKNAGIAAVAVGNGTAGRETELFLRELLKSKEIDIPVVMVSESGASVYSASTLARDEFPDLDITVRGAISIARRLQDPLAELVKIDPKSIGVGQYQHDVSPSRLKKSLESVVSSCVNSVGVDLNTASVQLLSHVSGIGEALAKNIVEYRKEHGLFKSLAQLEQVPRFSTKAFEQSAGFLRIQDGEQVLDATGVHPERYEILGEMASKLGVELSALMGSGSSQLKGNEEFVSLVGEFTAADIIDELAKPGRDPREEFIPFSFHPEIKEVKDLQLGMQCPGIVSNVTNFGAFVDIGVHQDGLVHLSEISNQFVSDPKEFINPGDRVSVRVVSVDVEKRRIGLSLKTPEEASAVRRKKRPQRGPRDGKKFGAKGGGKGRDGQGGRRDSRPGKGGGHKGRGKGGAGRRPRERDDSPLTSNPFAQLGALKDKIKK